MTKQLLIFGLSLSMVIIGCAEPKKSRGQANTRGVRIVQNGNPASNPAQGGGETSSQALHCQGEDWGVIYSNDSQQAWQQRVLQFASASVHSSEVGFVSNNPNDTSTGISFCARVCEAAFGNGEVYVGIWDDRVNETTPEISVHVRGSNQYPTQLTNSAQRIVTFRDDYGTIIFTGSIQNNVFSGQMSFSNSKKIDTNGQVVPGHESGTLGDFRIAANRFFRCS